MEQRKSFSAAISCEKCGIRFKERKNLNAHCRNFHPEQNYLIKSNQICGLCSGAFRTIVKLQEHMQSQHSINLNYINETFYSAQDFLNWKVRIEKESQSSYILRNSSEKKDVGKKLSYYICHRSGCFKPKGGKIRQLKASGSNKSGYTCPAVIEVCTETIDGISEIKVLYQSVHVGHEMEVGRLRLTEEERTDIAANLHLGIPMTKILDETRRNFSPKNRLSLTTRKDLCNIKSGFKIQEETVMHQDDTTSIDILVKKLKNDEKNPVLIYKPVGEILQDYPSVRQNDFLFGLMNDAQEKLLEIYGSACIMIDSTHGTNQYGFELTTVMVHDENHEGLPVAVFFSSRTASDILLPFFDSIKKRIPNLTTKVLMSDDTNSFLNAWESIFNSKPLHLLCIWHVNRNINRNINSKVKTCNRENIKKQMNDIVTELDTTTFNSLIEKFVEKFKEEESSFVQYFETTYKKRPEKWAYCYRKGLGINTNMKLERWHRQIKYEESGGIVMKRLDKSIAVITNAIAKKLLARVISIERGKLTHKMISIRKRHASSIEMKEDIYSSIQLNENTFIITKTIGESIFTYSVEKINATECCPIKCDQCNVCIHSMSCTCIDYSKKFLI
ncbi:hypothetical protein HNY73_017532 [Argiope bruennichi]|uniref:C2H2-type domain-containing protein n=1 Tax=Argiope bruennichi TaxID=94029 RepID=A0A8T0EA88_ARGBR|nr:hypothetical protein HNY73_017532 [Argiope bruennichi]